MSFLYYLTLSLFLFICIFLILLILIQKGRGGGLSGAFGGGGGGTTAFGTKTGDVLTWTTSIVFGIFIFLAVMLNIVTNKLPKPSAISTPGSPTPQSPVGPASQS